MIAFVPCVQGDTDCKLIKDSFKMRKNVKAIHKAKLGCQNIDTLLHDICSSQDIMETIFIKKTQISSLVRLVSTISVK